MGRVGRLRESIHFDPFKVEVGETNLPLHRSVVELSIEADGDGAVVKVAPDYTLKYGLLGRLMNQIVVRRKFKQGMEDLLTGLKYHIETGEMVDNCVPDMSAAAD